jgi:hypothetical protein
MTDDCMCHVCSICLMYGAACRFAITLAAHPETQRNIEVSRP